MAILLALSLGHHLLVIFKLSVLMIFPCFAITIKSGNPLLIFAVVVGIIPVTVAISLVNIDSKVVAPLIHLGKPPTKFFIDIPRRTL
jgi:hypothetical protein